MHSHVPFDDVTVFSRGVLQMYGVELSVCRGWSRTSCLVPAIQLLSGFSAKVVFDCHHCIAIVIAGNHLFRCLTHAFTLWMMERLLSVFAQGTTLRAKRCRVA